MTYIKIAGVFSFLSVFIFSILLVMRIEKRKVTFRESILKNRVEDLKKYNIWSRLVRPFLPSKEELDKVKGYLNEIGYREISVEKVFIYSILLGILMGLMYFGALSLILNKILAALTIPMGILTGYKIPQIYLKSKYEEIQLEKQLGILPYVEMLQVACDAGLTLTLAIERVYEYYPSTLALEFKKANNDFMANIKTRRQSFQEIIERVGGDEISLLIESLIQSLDIGTPMKTT